MNKDIPSPIPLAGGGLRHGPDSHSVSAGSMRELSIQIKAYTDVPLGLLAVESFRRNTHGRNDPCPCGKTNRKYKHCCIDKLGTTFIAKIPFKLMRRRLPSRAPKAAEKVDVKGLKDHFEGK